MAPALGFAAGAAVSLVLAGPVAAMLAPVLSVRNYRGDLIPTAMGIVLLPAVLLALGSFTLAGRMGRAEFHLIAFWLTVVCMAGFMDDVAGNHNNRGFRGHFAALFRGQLTTGMAKVLLVCGGALTIADWSRGWSAMAEIGVLILAVNFFNQLDLRPGRALKTFIILAAALGLAGSTVAAAGCGGAASLLMGDLRAKYMLGDTGANLLGALLGVALVTALPAPWLLSALALLIAGNAAGEFLSFSRLIAGSRILLWLDQLGRRQAGE